MANQQDPVREMEEERLLDINDAARITKVKKSWWYSRTRLPDCGGLPVIWVGRYPRFKRDELMDYFRRQKHRKSE